MSGMQYLRRAYGPVPDPYFRAFAELEEDGKITINHKGDAMLVSIGAGASRQKLDLLQKEEVEEVRFIPLDQFERESMQSTAYVPHGTEYYKKIVELIRKELYPNIFK